MESTELLQTTDARMWAEEFCNTFNGKTVGGTVDVVLMADWFASAMAAQEIQDTRSGVHDETKVQRVIRLMREVSDLLDKLPSGLRSQSPNGIFLVDNVSPQGLRREADYMEKIVKAVEGS